MKARMTALATLLVTGGASLAIAVAPLAIAQPSPPPCQATEVGGGEEGGANTVCESPGNAEINSRPEVLAPGAMGGMGGIGGGMGGI